MQRRSWILLAICAVLAGFLAWAYIGTQSPPPTLTQQQTTQMLDTMRQAVAKKNINGILAYIAPQPDVKIAGLNQDQLRMMLARAFRGTGKLNAEYSNLVFTGGTDDATAEFDLIVTEQAPGMVAEDYKGHITLQLKRLDVPRFLGLFQTKEWRIVGAESTGPNLSNFGDY